MYALEDINKEMEKITGEKFTEDPDDDTYDWSKAKEKMLDE